MSKPTKKKAAGKAKAKTTKLPLTVTVRLDAGPRQKLRDISVRDGVSENALVQQLVDRYLDKLDLGPRVDAIEERVTRIEGSLSSGVESTPEVEPSLDPDDADDEEEEDEDVVSDDDDDDDDDEDEVDDDGGPPSLLDKVR